MNDADNRELIKRLTELDSRAASRAEYAYSHFLNIDQQNTALCLHRFSAMELTGGYDSAERKIAVFGNEELVCYPPSPPLTFIEISPRSQRFADELTHRDFLGSLMGLGINRDMLGDLIINENRGWLVCLSPVASFIVSELKKVKHTDVTCRITDILPESSVSVQQREVLVSSLRLDAVIAAVYGFSRSESSELFSRGKVFINGRATQDTSHTLSPGEKITVRGDGRFEYTGINRINKKGKYYITVEL